MTREIAVVVSAYNEAERLGETLKAVHEAFPGARILVADDHSDDATPGIATAAGAELVRAPRHVGKGGANTLALERLADPLPTVVLCDGDLGASARELPRLVEAIERDEGDLAVATFARRVGGGFGFAVGFSRWAIRRRTNGALEPAAPISGQRALRPELVPAVLPFAKGFGMETAMTIDAHRAGFRLVEVELPLEHRATGRTVSGFLHRFRQLLSFARVYVSRRTPTRGNQSPPSG